MGKNRHFSLDNTIDGKIKMNKTVVSAFIIFFAALIALQPASAALAPEYGYQIEVTNTTFLPSTIYAGDIINVEVELKNRSSETQLTNIEGKLELGDQFNGIHIVDSISDIIVGKTKPLAFEFQAKAGTPSGYYSVPLTITYSSNSDSLKQTQIILVPISKTDKSLDITIEPNVINPGKPTEVVFTIKNVGNTPVSNISLSWTETNNLVLPLGSDNKRFVDVLAAKQEAKVSYLITADPNITPGVYPLNISMTFNDIESTKTQTSIIGVIVGGTTDFEISAETLTTGQVSISIANIGSNNASAVVVRIPNQSGVTVSGSNTSILGNLNKGDFTLANFEIAMTSAQQMQLPNGQPGGTRPADFNAGSMQQAGRGKLEIEIDYTDTTGVRQSVEKTIEIASSTSYSGTTTQTGFAGRTRQTASSQYIPVSLLVLMAGGAIAFNRFKAGNKNWKKLGIIIALIIAMFLAAIFLLGSNLIAVITVTVASLAMLVWLFREKETRAFLGKAKSFLKKQKE